MSESQIEEQTRISVDSSIKRRTYGQQTGNFHRYYTSRVSHVSARINTATTQHKQP